MKANIVIIGGGISGVSIAYNLAKKGVKDIVVFDDNYMTGGATGRCGAGVRQQWGTKMNCILAKSSVDFFERAQKVLEYHRDIEFKQEGYLIVATTKEEEIQFAKNVKLQNSVGIPAKKLTLDEALKLKDKKYMQIKNLISLRTSKGIRHTYKLPVNGQRTKTNAQTRKKKGIQ